MEEGGELHNDPPARRMTPMGDASSAPTKPGRFSSGASQTSPTHAAGDRRATGPHIRWSKHLKHGDGAIPRKSNHLAAGRHRRAGSKDRSGNLLLQHQRTGHQTRAKRPPKGRKGGPPPRPDAPARGPSRSTGACQHRHHGSSRRQRSTIESRARARRCLEMAGRGGATPLRRTGESTGP